jgi:signal transduction histidine kinase
MEAYAKMQNVNALQDMKATIAKYFYAINLLVITGVLNIAAAAIVLNIPLH